LKARAIQMIYIKNLFSFMAVVLVVALLFLTVQDKADAICVVNVVKEATPSDGTDFDFTCTGGHGGNCNGNPEFTLMDGEIKNGIQFDVGDAATVVELVPDGWGLADINCEASDFITYNFNAEGNGVFMTCLTREALVIRTCTFRNKNLTTIPTLSEWGLITMAGVLGIIGFIAIRRRKVTA
jgi:exosortase sorting signal-containing protein